MIPRPHVGGYGYKIQYIVFGKPPRYVNTFTTLFRIKSTEHIKDTLYK